MTGHFFLKATRARCWGLLLPCLYALLLGCSSAPILSVQLEVDALQAKGHYAQAVDVLQKARPAYSNSAALLGMELGLLQHQAKQWQASNRAFAKADTLLEGLFTRSIVTQTGSLLSNENVVSYRGEASEAVMIHIYKGLNYVQLGDINAALVEMRRMDEKLTYIDRKNGASSGWSYREDAFGRWVSGLLYETAGGRTNLNDAHIAYKKALDAYAKHYPPQQAPQIVLQNLLSSAIALGPREVTRLRKRYAEVPYVPLAQKRQNAVLTWIHFAGRSPIKRETRIRAASSAGWVHIALPRYSRRSYRIHGSRVRVGDKMGQSLELVGDIGTLAERNLSKALPAITLKAIARVVSKQQLARAAKRSTSNESNAALLALVGNVYSVASESADLRSWSSLPDKVFISQVVVPPGEHHMRVDYLSAQGGKVRSQDLGLLKAQKGSSHLFVLHTRD